MFLFFVHKLLSLNILSKARALDKVESFDFTPCKAFTELESVSMEEDANSFSKLAIEFAFLVIFAQIFVIL